MKLPGIDPKKIDDAYTKVMDIVSNKTFTPQEGSAVVVLLCALREQFDEMIMQMPADAQMLAKMAGHGLYQSHRKKYEWVIISVDDINNGR